MMEEEFWCGGCETRKPKSAFTSRHGEGCRFVAHSLCRICKNKNRADRVKVRKAEDPGYRNYKNVIRKISKGQKNPKGCLPKWADRKKILKIYRECAEKGEGHQVDHVIPLQHPKVCGLHVHENLQVLTSLENNQKNNIFVI